MSAPPRGVTEPNGDRRECTGACDPDTGAGRVGPDGRIVLVAGSTLRSYR